MTTQSMQHFDSKKRTNLSVSKITLVSYLKLMFIGEFQNLIIYMLPMISLESIQNKYFGEHPKSKKYVLKLIYIIFEF